MLGFFREADVPDSIPVLTCAVCKRPIISADWALVLQLDREEADDEPFNPLLDEIERHVGLPAIVVHKGDCDDALSHTLGSRVSKNIDLLQALATALHNAGVKDVPDRWFSSRGREELLRPVPPLPPSPRTMFMDADGKTWKASHVDEEGRRVRLASYLREKEPDLVVDYDEFQARFTPMQEM